MLVSAEISLLLLTVLVPALQSFADDGPMRRLISRSSQSTIIERIKERRYPGRLSRKEICYDLLGCFDNPRRASTLKKPPQSPTQVDTKFWMYTRELNMEPKLLNYDRQESFIEAKFDITRPVKMIIHGYKGSGREKGTLVGAKVLLERENCTVILVDWERGAGDVSYSMAVANTELVGRQTALLILDMLVLGVPIANVHIIGFSLGAHVAGCAGYVLKEKGYTLGRITGLDPASPIFRSATVLSEARKLDRDDAAFVDIIHTDGSPVWTEGFGLLKPLGHVDFFPNGGREQPGCSDGRGSVIVTYLEGSTNTSVVCSHIRAWRLFVESIQPNSPTTCRFRSFPCRGGLDAFNQGFCFGNDDAACLQGSPNTCSVMGYPSDKSPARGPLYLVTRDDYPYCGEQLRAIVLVSEKTKRTRGILQLRLIHGKGQTPFSFQCDFLDVVRGGRLMRAIAAAEFGTVGPNVTPEIKASLSYRSLAFQDPLPADELQQALFIDRLIVQDLDGNRWYFCGKDTLLEQNKNGSTFDEITVILKTSACSI